MTVLASFHPEDCSQYGAPESKGEGA